jgi:hypothetical protein
MIVDDQDISGWRFEGRDIHGVFRPGTIRREYLDLISKKD